MSNPHKLQNDAKCFFDIVATTGVTMMIQQMCVCSMFSESFLYHNRSKFLCMIGVSGLFTGFLAFRQSPQENRNLEWYQERGIDYGYFPSNNLDKLIKYVSIGVFSPIIIPAILVGKLSNMFDSIFEI